MKFVIFGPEARVGVIQQSRILDLEKAAQALGGSAGVPQQHISSAFISLRHLIEQGDRGLDLVRTVMEKAAGSDQPGLHVELAGAKLHAPFPGRRFGLTGRNYADHVANAFTNMGKPITAEEVTAKSRLGRARGFWVVDPPEGPGADVPYPSSSNGLFDYEGEVAIVLGKNGKRIKADRWRDHLWGTTLVIDWSVRSASLVENTQPFYANKIFDGSKSLGPWIAVDEVDPSSCGVETHVNGQLRQRFNSRDMIHTFGELLEQMSEELTLHAGDVLSGGTGAGTATDSTIPRSDGSLPLDLFLKPGDTVEVSSPDLGVLNARVVAGS